MAEKLVDTRPRPVCIECGFIFYQGPKLAAATVVIRDGQVLLNQRDIQPGRGLWSFPSGYVDIGETVEDAAIREAREETGLAVRIEGLVGVYSDPDRPVVLVVYLGTITGGDLIIGHETQDVRFFNFNDLPAPAFDHDAQILAAARKLALRR